MSKKSKQKKPPIPQQNNQKEFHFNLDDMDCLAPEMPLTDSVMDYWVDTMWDNFLPSYKQEQTFCYLPAILYSKLVVQPSPEPFVDKFKRIRETIPVENIFNHTYVFFLLNPENHWILGILHNSGEQEEKDKTPNCFYLLDSCEQAFKSVHEDSLKPFRDFFALEYNIATKKQIDFSEHSIKVIPQQNVPQQDNEYDCGLYALGFIEQFIKIPFSQEQLTIHSSWANFPYSVLRENMYTDIVRLVPDSDKHLIPNIVFREI